jgi:4-diphosphocytidyl-2-C-methyl-D-erythritol kinase
VISFPNAKINLGLNIIEKRKDGFHNISSFFYPIKLADVLEVIETAKFSFSSTGLPIPGDESNNLVVRAYQLIKKDFDLPQVSIHLHKTIPTGAGLGGGSSDGAFMLKMLNTLFELYMDDTVLADYALQLGSDCPFFISNESMIASGRGDELAPYPINLEGYFFFLVKPDQAISTHEAYQLIKPRSPDISISGILVNQPPESWKGMLVNDFEEAIFQKIPEYRNIKDTLYEHGAVYASMTGSGSAFYGIFKDKPGLAVEFPPSYFTWEEIL